ncbi:hypothetical protein [Mesobacillus maritimus]|nr:hypothetical protein [Mesobacillus maritimus]
MRETKRLIDFVNHKQFELQSYLEYLLEVQKLESRIQTHKENII